MTRSTTTTTIECDETICSPLDRASHSVSQYINMTYYMGEPLDVGEPQNAI